MGLGVYYSDNIPLVLHNSVTYVTFVLLNCVFVFSLLLVSWHSDTLEIAQCFDKHQGAQ